MWFSRARKVRRTPITHKPRKGFRPQLEALEDRRLMSAGAVDTSFGSGGKVSTSLLAIDTNGSNHPSVAVQADGKIITGSYVTGANGYKNFALVRYNADGTLDSTFGPNHTGVVTSAVGAQDAWVNGIAIDASGKIVAVGHAINQAGRNLLYVTFATARYTSNGVLDSTFGSGGIVLTNFAPADSYTDQGLAADAVVIQADGKIDVGGTSQTETVSGKGAKQTVTITTNFTLVRYNSSGILDTGFGSGGIVVTPQFGGLPNHGNELALQPDGKIILAGFTGTSPGGTSGVIAVARYTPAGNLDSTFNNTGIMTFPQVGANAEAHGVAVQSGGAIVIGGSIHGTPGNDATVILGRVTSGGQLDPSFGTAGTGLVIDNNVAPTADAAWALAQHPNGDLVTYGTFWGNKADHSTWDMLVKAYLPDGAPDSSFGTNGATTTGVPGIDDRGRGIAIQPDGKIVGVGYFFNSSGGLTVELARFQAPNTKINFFTATPNLVTAGDLVTLAVSGIRNNNTSSTITSIVFYLDAVGGTPLTVTFISNSNGTWRYSFDTTGLASGTHTLYAEAVNTNGVFSDPATVSVTVN